MKKGHTEPLNPEQATAYAMRLLQQRDYSEARLRQKLVFRNTPEPIIDTLIEKLKSLGLINDARYAELLVRNEATWRKASPRAIEAKLYQKGISDVIRKSALQESEGPDETERAFYHAARYWKKVANDVPAIQKQKITAYLYRRGFSGTAIKEALAKLSL